MASKAETSSVFVRNSTGLVRELSGWDVFVMNTIGTNPMGNYAVLFTLGLAVFIGANLWLSTLTGILIGISIVVLYGLFAAAMPRSGGDYVYVSRVLHPSVGFIISWLMLFTVAFYVGYNGWAFAAWIIPDVVGVFGQWIGSPLLVSIAAALPQTLWVVVVGIVGLGLYYLICSKGLRSVMRWQQLAFALAVLSFLVAIPMMLAAPAGSFITNFNSFAAHYGTSASQVLAIAHKNGYTGAGGFSWGSTFGFWPFVMELTGYAIISIPMGGEVRNAKRAQIRGIFWANAVGGVIVAIFFFVTAMKENANLAGALGYFNFINGAHSPFPFPLYSQVLAGIITNSPWITLLVGLGVFFGIFAAGLTLALWATRYLFAWSFDRLAPSSLADIHEKSHSPRNALIVTMLVSWIFTLLLTFDVNFTFVSVGLLEIVLFIIVSIAGIVLPYKMKDLYNATIKGEVLGIPTIVLAAVISLIFNLIMAYYYLTNGAYGATSTISWEFVGVLLLSGIVFYTVRVQQLKSQGIDVNLAFKEIPPE